MCFSVLNAFEYFIMLISALDLSASLAPKRILLMGESKEVI